MTKEKEIEILKDLQRLQMTALQNDITFDIDVNSYHFHSSKDFTIMLDEHVYNIFSDKEVAHVEGLLTKMIFANLIFDEVEKLELDERPVEGEVSSISEGTFEVEFGQMIYEIKYQISYILDEYEGAYDCHPHCEVREREISIEDPIDENWNKLFISKKDLKDVENRINKKL